MNRLAKTNLPILLYHDVYPDNIAMGEIAPERRHYAVTVGQFRRQLHWLQQEGFRSVSAEQLAAESLNGGQHHSDKQVLITFDDGHISQYHFALPILREFDMTALFFVVPGWVTQPQFLSWQHLREMNDCGMSIQSHTLSHQFLVELVSKQLVDELRISKLEIEQQLGKPVRHLSLPGGRSERSVWRFAGAFGYQGIFTSNPGYAAFKPIWQRFDANGHSPVAYHRFAIDCQTTMAQFRALLSSPWSKTVLQTRGRYLIGAAVKRILGDNVYDRFWLWRHKRSFYPKTMKVRSYATPVQN